MTTIRVEYNDRYGEWEIDSRGPHWVHSAADTREQAVQIARKYARKEDDIVVKGPRMNQFKKV